MDPVSRSSSPAQGWSPLRIALGLGLVLLTAWAGYRAWADIFNIAVHDEEASQVWLVLPVFAWLVFVRKDPLAAVKPKFSWLGPILIGLGWAISAHGFFHMQQALWHGGVVLILVGAFATVAGPALMRKMIPVLPVLLFLIPVPGLIRQKISIPMQTYTASASEFVFQLIALPVSRSGNILNYNGQDIAVAEACNGMRMIFALLLVTYAFAFVTPLRPSVRAMVLILSPIAAVVCNVLRLIPTVVLYGHYPDTWGPTFHDFSGWAMLIVAFLLLMGLVRLLQWAEVPVMQEKQAPASEKPSTPDRKPVPGAGAMPSWSKGA